MQNRSWARTRRSLGSDPIIQKLNAECWHFFFLILIVFRAHPIYLSQSPFDFRFGTFDRTYPMKLLSWNVNGIRARQHQLQAVTTEHSPDILALQETKVVDDDFPLATLQDLGYPHVAYYGQKGHYGVAIASRAPLEQVQLGIPWRSEDQQRRFLSRNRRKVDGVGDRAGRVQVDSLTDLATATLRMILGSAPSRSSARLILLDASPPRSKSWGAIS